MLVLLVSAVITAAPDSSLRLASEDGSAAIELRVVAQLLAQLERHDEEFDGDIEFRRLRTVLHGSLMEERLSFAMQLNLLPGSVELLDLSGEWKLTDSTKTRLGVMKIPFTRHRLGSMIDNPLVDWSLPTKYFGAERQLGVMIHNGIKQPSSFEYQVGLFTGAATRSSNGVGIPLAYDSLRPSPSRLDGPGELGPIRGELVAHVAHNERGIDPTRFSDVEGGPLRWSVGFSAALDFDPEPRQDMRLRVAPELEVRFHGMTGRSVIYVGLFDPTNGGRTFQPGLWGALLCGAYRVSEFWEVALRYTLMRITPQLRTDSGTTLAGQQEATVGINVYLDKVLRWQIDAGLLIDDQRRDTNYHLTGRTQLQLVF